ncbi:MAG: ATP-dependent Clp protease ATP-binding subunit ClpX [Lachnospiraceae bacterium]|nr:ATP-dependent Clp protease ATP-binding subunit ClpX [Lachnospiraceae bacterium]
MDNEERYCSMCGRPESLTGKLMRLPMNILLCPDCMDKTSDMVESQMGNMNGAGAIDWNKVMSMYSNGKANPDIINQEMQKGKEEEEKSKQDLKSNKGGKPEDDKKDKKEEKPKVNFISFADLPFDLGLGGKQRVKKREKKEYKPLLELKDIPAPHKIKEMLDEYVIGQEHAKKVMSVAVYNHYKRVATYSMDTIEIEKSNMLMLGPTGCGKTYLVRTLARILKVPLAVTDATSLTEAGYIGDDIESVLSKLLAAADNDVDKAEQGIVYIDEIDKIAKKASTNSRDVSGESVQQGLLKLLEGADIEVPVGASSKNAMVPTTSMNTRNILFICGGAFPGIEEIIKQRLNKTGGIGFQAEVKLPEDKERTILKEVETEDIRKFGMIPEFVGRLPMVFALEGLDEKMMVRILKEPKNAILKQYQKLLELDEVKLEFTEDALELIAKKALKKETGARALRSILDEYMVDIMYEIPKDSNIGTVTITKEYLEGTGGPKIEMRTS